MKLADWMFEHGWTPAKLQRTLGLKSRSTVGRYIYDQQVPLPRVLRKIENLTGGKVLRDDFTNSSPPKCFVPIKVGDGKTKLVSPWSRNDRYWAAIVENVKSDTPLEDRSDWQIRMSLAIHGHRAKPLPNGLYLLDGRVVDRRRLVAMANRLRILWGQEPIPYPGVDGGRVL